ncbi:MAG: hypothetical protein ACK53Y_13055, partial [bacterium]
MMRSLLHAAGLGPEYWSWALIHAAYLKKKRLPHSAIPITQTFPPNRKTTSKPRNHNNSGKIP